MTDTDCENALAELLEELADVQSELLDVLRDKRIRMASGQPQPDPQLQQRESQLLDRLQACHRQRQELLDDARQQGYPAENLGALAVLVNHGNERGMVRKVKQASARMRLLRHESLANWVLAQKTLLHLSQMLEIVATGGRLRPTYGRETLPVSCGTLVDQEI